MSSAKFTGNTSQPGHHAYSLADVIAVGTGANGVKVLIVGVTCHGILNFLFENNVLVWLKRFLMVFTFV